MQFHSRIVKFLRRIINGVYSRWHYYIGDLVRSRVAQIYVAWRWYFKSDGRHHQLPAALIVSLTSYPPRFDTLVHTLRSLLRQTVKPDHIILWIAHSDFSLLPKKITDLQEVRLEIRATDDMKSYLKIIPALDAFPDAFICTADDDIYYWPTWLEELIEGVTLPSNIVVCHRAHELTFDSQNQLRPYSQWVYETRTRGQLKDLFPTGVGGVLYPPGILRHTAEDRKAFATLCPSADDIWLYWIGRRNGAKYKTTKHWRKFIQWSGSQKLALWRKNVSKGGNDEQIQQMISHYGFQRPQ